MEPEGREALRPAQGPLARPGPSGDPARSKGESPGSARSPLPPPGARRREPAPGRGSRGRGARARPREGEGTWRVTWTRAMARGVRSAAGAPGPSLPRRPGVLLGPHPEASKPGRPSSAPRRCPRGPGRRELPGRPAAGTLTRGVPGSPHPLPYSGRPRSRGDRGKGLSRRAGGRERGLRHPRRSVTAAATTTKTEVLLPTCREDTEHARAETTSG